MSNSLWLHGLHAAYQASLSSTISQSLLQFLSIESVMLSNHLILWCPPLPFAFNLSQHQGLFQWVSCLQQVAKVLELQLQHQSFQWIFRVDFLWDWLVWSPYCTRVSQESSPAPRFKSINSLALSLLYGSKDVKAMTNLDSILKSRDITLQSKVHIAKAKVFPAVMDGCESWTIQIFFLDFLAFSMIQWMLAILPLVPLCFLNPACTSESSWFIYCWSIAWGILSITLLACEMSAVVQ